MGTPKRKLAEYMKSDDAIARELYYENKIKEVQLQLDKVLARIHKARVIKRTRELSPKEQDLLDEILEQKVKLVDQIIGLRREMAR